MIAVLNAVMPGLAERPTTSLDGPWSFRLDPQDTGHEERWFDATVRFTNTIQVPGAWQAQGYGTESDKLWHHYEGRAWYKRQVRLSSPGPGRRLFLCVGGVHRSAEVWINGHFLGEHVGYLSPFEFDVTGFAGDNPTTIAFCVDGRQRWDVDCLTGCFDIIDEMFTPWGGIWGHVWLETRGAAWLEEACVQPTLTPPGCLVTARIFGSNADAVQLEVYSREGGLAGQTTEWLPPASVTPTNRAVRLSTPIRDARLWSPESPYLYTARLLLKQGDQIVDEVNVRFGLREIAIRDGAFWLNQKKLFLRGYGDDAIYPKTMAAASDKRFYLKKLQAAREYGFNFVRHHSHILPPEYYEAADEVGMLVSAEFPIAYESYYQRAKGPAIDLYRSEWTAVITRLRNHPSIFDWCMSNEMGDSFPLAPELYRAAKMLDPTRPVIDADGLSLAGLLHRTDDRDTLDFYSVQFDEWSLPADNPGKYRFDILPKKPVVSHETGNYLTVPRLDLIDEFKDNFKPFWLVPFRAKLQKLGLLGEAERWSLNSERLYGLAHKLNLEDMRQNPRISGYTWWLLQDYWTGANGLFDAYFRPKSISPEFVRRFNNAVVLLQDGLPFTCQGGRLLKVKLLVSNYGPESIREGALTWSVSRGTRLLETRQVPVKVAQGELASAAMLAVNLPAVSQPEPVVLKAQLRTAKASWHNEWTTWLYPEFIGPPRLNVPLYASHDMMRTLAVFGARPLSGAALLPQRAVFVVSEPTTNLLPAVEAGACLVCLSPQWTFANAQNRFKPAWWLGSEGDCNAGTVVYDNPLTRAIAPEGWCDQGWYRLLEGAQAYVLDEFPAQPEVLVRGLDAHSLCRSKALIFQARVGNGSLIVSGLRLDPGASVAAPEQSWLLARLIEYAGTLPQPKAALPVVWLRERMDQVPALAGPALAGFARVLSRDAEQLNYPSYRGTDAPLLLCRQSETGRTLEWETALVPTNWTESTVTFAFAGGLGWESQPKTDGFVVLVNGRELLSFDLARSHQVWFSHDRAANLRFFPRRSLTDDTLGVFYLTLPVEQLTRGEPCRLAVRSQGQGSQRWFGLNPDRDLP